METIKQILGIKDKAVYLSVHDGKLGIETYIDESIKSFPEAYKEQIKAFLEGAIKVLENGRKN